MLLLQFKLFKTSFLHWQHWQHWQHLEGMLPLFYTIVLLAFLLHNLSGKTLWWTHDLMLTKTAFI